jgi:hypothetical protein
MKVPSTTLRNKRMVSADSNCAEKVIVAVSVEELLASASRSTGLLYLQHTVYISIAGYIPGSLDPVLRDIERDRLFVGGNQDTIGGLVIPLVINLGTGFGEDWDTITGHDSWV